MNKTFAIVFILLMVIGTAYVIYALATARKNNPLYQLYKVIKAENPKTFYPRDTDRGPFSIYGLFEYRFTLKDGREVKVDLFAKGAAMALYSFNNGGDPRNPRMIYVDGVKIHESNYEHYAFEIYDYVEKLHKYQNPNFKI